MAPGLLGFGREASCTSVFGIAAVLTAWFFSASLAPVSLAIYAPSPSDQRPEFCTVFNHMVKSGGTSIKTQLEQSSQVEGDAFPGMCTYGGKFTTPELCLDALHNSSVIAGYGEVLRDPLEKAGRSCDFFTMIRHPVPRLVSAFYFCPDDDRLDRPDKWCGHIESETPITERLLDFARGSVFSRVTFAEMMFGLRCPPGFALCDPNVEPIEFVRDMRSEAGRQALFKMQENFRSYKAIGIFEHWELSMQLFDATVTSSVRHWNNSMALNPGPTPPERQELLRWAYTNPEIHATLATDILLYQFCVSVFKQQTRDALGTEWE
eukprot:g11997.t2